jgi:hypothetical protein
MSFRLAAAVLGALVMGGVIAAPALDALSAAPEAAGESVVQTAAPVVVAVASPEPPAAKPEVQPTEAVAAPGPVAAPAEPTPEPAPADLVVIEPSEVSDETEWVGPPEVIPDCDARMAAAGIDYASSRLPVHKTRGGIYCGAEQVVRYRKGPGAISWGGSPKVTCPVALGMAKLESIVQEEAERHLGRKVRRIQHMGTYNCREMANYPGWVSEHSYANAIDIKHFELTNGKKIPVLGTYPRNGAEPKNASGRFLKAVARRLYDERVFSVVLTPSFDSNHRNHFHLDMARYLVDGT